MFTSAGGHRPTPPAVGSYIVTILTSDIVTILTSDVSALNT